MMEEQGAGFLSKVDRRAAIDQLVRRLQPRDLRAALESVQDRPQDGKSVEWIVAETESSDRRFRSRLPQEQIPEFLVDLGGADLLADKQLRYWLALRASPDERETLHEYDSESRSSGGARGRAKAIASRRWHPGKRWAQHFIRTLGFPEVFAGFPGGATPPPVEEVEPFVPLPELRDFQEKLKAGLLEVLHEDRPRRCILTLPTGAGKTRTAVEALLHWRQTVQDRRGILWIAQSEELCEQAVQAFREVWIDQGHRSHKVRDTLVLHRLWGGTRNEIPSLPTVVIASIQKLHSIVQGGPGGSRVQALRAMADHLGVVLVDEAHRILAPSYSQVLGFLGVAPQPGDLSSDLALIGLTATPFRGQEHETRKLASRFQGRLLQPSRSLAEFVERLRVRGILSHPEHQILTSPAEAIVLENYPHYLEHYERFEDFHPDLLRQLGQDRARNRLLLHQLLQLPEDWPVLFFGCSVEHATAMAVLLNRRGRRAAIVSADTRQATRRFLIEEFRSHRVSVLCNYGVLTTGFDAPKVRAVVVARPTASPLLYEQMIGRGMRGPEFGGTEKCLVIDVEDNIQFQGQMAFTRFESYWR